MSPTIKLDIIISFEFRRKYENDIVGGNEEYGEDRGLKETSKR